MNTLYLGDCLYVLRENIPDESVNISKYFRENGPKLQDMNITFKAVQHAGKRSNGQMTLEV
jgi:hypothetical protein